MPPAFNLSQDQTLQFNPSSSIAMRLLRTAQFSLLRSRLTQSHCKVEFALTIGVSLGSLLWRCLRITCVTQCPHLSAVQFLKSVGCGDTIRTYDLRVMSPT